MSGERDAASLWPYLLLCALLAVWIDFGNHHRFENADSVIPILVSLQDWTLFYWGQKRYGMLVPLLASGVASPLANLLVQCALTIFAGLATGFLLARYFVGGRIWPLVGLLDTALMLWLAPDIYRWRLLGTSLPYGVTLALALAGLLLVRGARWRREDRARIAAAFIAFLLALWLSEPTALIVIALVWFPRIGALARDPRRIWRDPGVALPSALVLAAHVIVRIAVHFAPLGRSVFGVRDPVNWPAGWAGLLRRLPELLGSFEWLLAGGALALVGLALAVWRARTLALAPPALRAIPVLIGTAALYGLSAGTIRWVVIDNHAKPQYLIPSVQLLSCALAIAALAPWLEREKRLPASLVGLGVAAAFVAALASYGLPSLAGVRRDLRDSSLGRYSEAVVGADCTHLAGSYWKVWPTVLHVKMLRHAADRDAELWGIAYRSEATREQARRASDRAPRVCMLSGAEPQRVAAYGFGTLSLVGRRGEVEIFEPERAAR